MGTPKERDHVVVICIDERVKTSVKACRGANLPSCLTMYTIKTVKTENY